MKPYPFRYVVNITILFYQLGMCSVAILFISDNMVHLLGHYFDGSEHLKMIIMASIATVFIMITNMFTQMRIVSIFAMISSIFFLLGTIAIMQYTIQQPNQWETLPGSTNFTGTIMFIGMSMYAFEGQTMVNKQISLTQSLKFRFYLWKINSRLLRISWAILVYCLQLWCSVQVNIIRKTMQRYINLVFMTALGFYGYTAFGDKTAPTITTNVPLTG
jgi:hypothetical protein